jgi:hypothetical protein
LPRAEQPPRRTRLALRGRPAIAAWDAKPCGRPEVLTGHAGPDSKRVIFLSRQFRGRFTPRLLLPTSWTVMRPGAIPCQVDSHRLHPPRIQERGTIRCSFASARTVRVIACSTATRPRRPVPLRLQTQPAFGRAGASVLIESEPKLWIPVSTRFLYANWYPLRSKEL